MHEGKEIIVVEDDASMSQAIERLLKAVGLHSRTFTSGEALLESPMAHQAACFIFDVRLPGLSGFELRARLRDLGINRPVIFITAYDQASARDEATQTTAAGFFPKPFDGRSLLVAITQALGALLLIFSTPLAIAQNAPLAKDDAFDFKATVPNTSPKPKSNPPGMVWIPGGEFSMGAAVNGHGSGEKPMASNDAAPIHRVRVDGFWMDETSVTNEQFGKFVKATGYKTIAERTPTKEEFPTAPVENLVAGSVVFSPPEHEVPLNNHFQWWTYVKGANWRHPLGPDTDIKGKEKHPVVHIAYADAEAYAKWAEKRLPTEAEFEFAERGGLSGKTYAWGDEFRPKGKWMANTWQGKFPVKDAEEDGFAGLAPVKSFPPNGYGLYDMAGNVWQWCSDWYRADYYSQLAIDYHIAINPPGPEDPFDPAEPNEKKRVHRGGSFLCNEHYCSRYIVGTRGKGEVSTGTNHLGFRCVKSVEPERAPILRGPKPSSQ
jgi:formylglycine-generating enzyme required for sulfatase activity